MLSKLFVAMAIAASTVLAGALPDGEASIMNVVPKRLRGMQKACYTEDCMALTFDDGIYKNMGSITDTAVAAGIKVTFFINLFNYACSYDEEYSSQLVYAHKKGMQICNHSSTHPHFSNLTYAQMDREIEQVEQFMLDVAGFTPSCFRLPYGDGNSTVIKYLNDKHNLVVLNWNEYSGDADGETVQFAKDVYNKIHTPEKALVLNHEPHDTTANIVFPYAIKKLMQNGYKKENFQTVSESMGFPPYKKIGKPGKRDASWNCKAAIAARCETNPNPDICGPNGPKKTT